MLRSAFFALVLAASSAGAETAELAEYWANSGSLPPEYAWDVGVTITADGQLLLKRCEGYETEGPGCVTRKAKVNEAQRQAILDAAATAGLAANPARATDDPPIGGGATGGAVWIDGTKYDLPPWPVSADAERVGLVLRAIEAAIPTRLRNRFFGAN